MFETCVRVFETCARVFETCAPRDPVVDEVAMLAARMTVHLRKMGKMSSTAALLRSCAIVPVDRVEPRIHAPDGNGVSELGRVPQSHERSLSSLTTKKNGARWAPF